MSDPPQEGSIVDSIEVVNLPSKRKVWNGWDIQTIVYQGHPQKIDFAPLPMFKQIFAANQGIMNVGEPKIGNEEPLRSAKSERERLEQGRRLASLVFDVSGIIIEIFWPDISRFH